MQRLGDLLRRLAQGETRRAIQVAAKLSAQPPLCDPQRIRAEFIQLLRRRGYFVDSAAQLKASLAEIRALGRGFDLYDLDLSLRRLERTLAREQEKRHDRRA